MVVVVVVVIVVTIIVVVITTIIIVIVFVFVFVFVFILVLVFVNVQRNGEPPPTGKIQVKSFVPIDSREEERGESRHDVTYGGSRCSTVDPRFFVH
jgi:hypothetical protein